MAQVFGVRTHIVPVREGTTEIHRLQQVASVAAARRGRRSRSRGTWTTSPRARVSGISPEPRSTTQRIENPSRPGRSAQWSWEVRIHSARKNAAANR